MPRRPAQGETLIKMLYDEWKEFCPELENKGIFKDHGWHHTPWTGQFEYCLNQEEVIGIIVIMSRRLKPTITLAIYGSRAVDEFNATRLELRADQVARILTIIQEKR